MNLHQQLCLLVCNKDCKSRHVVFIIVAPFRLVEAVKQSWPFHFFRYLVEQGEPKNFHLALHCSNVQ